MISSRLTAFTFATLLSSAAFAATTDGTGPTDPVQAPNSPATEGMPKLNTDGTGGGLNNGQPPANGTDPRVQGNDAGRQGGMNTPNSNAPDNAETGTGSKTTTGGSGSEGGASQ
ncbi:hypothetical protein PSH58_08160 [Pseudomonas hefeiensis]|uniref:Uncharacterized protein n=1 Tax=Pseudomonas hefeiensis TaxID=2738125 RepID=A0ABY9GFA8_9PSED|nr:MULTISPECIES: hypothetical protein [unclassified Pseudomonas]MCQ6259584.1 hypothetical protein [Pseudomonas sp. Q11]WLH14283.1 hypothetical protein PSH57_08155 [Pseudomonas sp. FP205]WLH97342.1 hypothetical protein PSH58_08160 [Pseudomonas sp. FP53]WLI41621.1 hypothetical protein PSH74_08145 [Pseudomonas sp. FP821]